MKHSLIFAAILCSIAAAQAPNLEALTHAQNFEARRESSSNADLTRNGDAKNIPPGETLTLADIDGPGAIVHFWHTVSHPDPFPGKALVLRVYYDGQEAPSIVAPLGDFFGLGYDARAEYTSAVTTVVSTGRSRNCYWNMPFRKHLRMTVTNDSPLKCDSFYYHINWQKRDALPEDTRYLHAQYRQEHPALPGNYTVLDVQGSGHYVGTVYSAFQMEMGWFGEGDDFFYIDGAEVPQLRGTGTEEYFLDAWGFRPFQSPYGGVPVYEGVFPGDKVSLYRWHLPDPVPFTSSLKVELEHRGSIFNRKASPLESELANFEERADWLSSVAFWYQYPPVALDSALPPLETRMPPCTILKAVDLTRRADPAMLVVPIQGAVGYLPNQKKAAIEFDFDLEKPGHYRIDADMFYAVLFGTYQAYLDGKAIAPVKDFNIINADLRRTNLDTHELEAGTHTLRFESVQAVSPNQRVLAPTFNALALEKLILTRLEDCAGFHETLNRLMEKK